MSDYHTTQKCKHLTPIIFFLKARLHVLHELWRATGQFYKSPPGGGTELAIFFVKVPLSIMDADQYIYVIIYTIFQKPQHFKETGLRVNAICPNFFYTDFLKELTMLDQQAWTSMRDNPGIQCGE